MADTNETIADITAKMRNYSNACNDGYHTDYGVVCTDMRNYADRLDRARMRMEIEMANLRKENAKLREALDESRQIASDLGGCRLNDYWKLNEIAGVCEAALATTSNQNTQEDNQ